MSYPKTITKTIRPFNYVHPQTLAMAVSFLNELGDKAKLLAGGTDLLPLMKQRAIVPEYVINIKDIVGLVFILDEDELRIGALTTIVKLRDSIILRNRYASIFEATTAFATPQIRNLATIGGNICRSSPAADMVPPLIAFDAEVKLVGPRGNRRVPLKDFFTGVGRNVLDKEILTEIIIPHPRKSYGTAFEKIERASADLAKINCAVRVSITNKCCDDIRIALGAVAETPVRATKTEQALIGEILSEKIIESALQRVAEDISPITDVRSTAAYRAQVSKVLVGRAIRRAMKSIAQ
jgi:carbon-monoxide dehydrogenase medium subunit